MFADRLLAIRSRTAHSYCTFADILSLPNCLEEDIFAQ